jgi:hypothetical protein
VKKRERKDKTQAVWNQFFMLKFKSIGRMNWILFYTTIISNHFVLYSTLLRIIFSFNCSLHLPRNPITIRWVKYLIKIFINRKVLKNKMELTNMLNLKTR